MQVYNTPVGPPKPASDDAGALDEKTAAKFLGCSPRKLLEMRRAGDAPPFFRIGNRVRYPVHLLRIWMEQVTQAEQSVAVWPRRSPAGGET